MKRPLGPKEISWILQQAIEGLEPEQEGARDLLVKRCGKTYKDATNYVRQLYPAFSAVLREALERAENPMAALIEFSRLAPPSAYKLDVA